MVTETQCDLGLTALRLNDCLDIMAEHYPEKFKELSEYLAIKARREQRTAADSDELAEPVKTGKSGRNVSGNGF